MNPDRGVPASDKNEESDRRDLARRAGTLAGVGLQFAGAILVFLYAGQWVDRRFGTAPWFLLIGVFVGAIAGFYSLYRKLMSELAREERSKRR
jgi:ATP synthase protein I